MYPVALFALLSLRAAAPSSEAAPAPRTAEAPAEPPAPPASDAPRVASEPPPASAPSAESEESIRQELLKRGRRYPRLERPWFWVTTVAGVGLSVAGGVYYFDAKAAREELDKQRVHHRGAVLSTVDAGRKAQNTALVLGGAAVLSFGAAAFIYLQPVEAPPVRVALVPAPGGAVASVGGVLP